MSRKVKLSLALAGLIILFFVVLGVGIMWIFSDASASLFEGGGTLVASEHYDGVTEVFADLTNYSAEVQVWDGADVSVEFYSRGLFRAEAPEFSLQGGRLSIREPARFGGLLRVGKVLVRVPQGQILPYVLHTVSGSIRLDAPTERADLLTVSGLVRVYQGGEVLKATTTSGSVKVYGGGKSLTARTVSGSIKVYDPFGELDLHTTSGSIKGAADGGTTQVRLESTSGSLKLRLSGVTGYTLYGDTASGSVKDQYSGNQYAKNGTNTWGDGTLPIHARTTSGSIQLTDWSDE